MAQKITNDNVNYPVEIFGDGYTTVFIFKDTDGFWFWQFSDIDAKEYFKRHGIDFKSWSQDMVEMFCDDSENQTLGCSGGSFETIEELKSEF